MSLFDDNAMNHLRKTAHEAVEFEAWVGRQVEMSGSLDEDASEKADGMRSDLRRSAVELCTMLPKTSAQDLSHEVANLALSDEANAEGLSIVASLLEQIAAGRVG